MIIFIVISGVSVSATAKTFKPLSVDSILAQQGYTAMPITIKNGFLYVRASVNKHSAMAILDTGSSGINVAKSMIKELNLTAFDTKKNGSVDMHGKKSFNKAVKLSRVSVGNVQLGCLTANIFQHVLPSSTPVLVVGRDFLRQHHAIIDLYNKKLYLGRKKLSQHELSAIKKALLNKEFLAVPLMSLGSGSVVIPLQINHSQPVNFLFDTGTGITLLSQEYAKMLHLKQRNKEKQITIKKLVMNPLNLSFQPKVSLDSLFVQPVNLTMLRKYLYVQGIFGLSDMIKARAIIFLGEGVVFLQSD